MPIKKYFLTGLLTWLPLVITIWALLHLVEILNAIFATMVHALAAFAPLSWTKTISELPSIPGLGAFFVVLLMLASGALVSNVAGRWFVRQWERLFTAIPIVKSIYKGVKKVSDTLFSSNGNAFRTALLVQYPRVGSWTIGFQTGEPGGEVQGHLGPDFVSVYVPTTPNPTSGFFLMLPRSEVIELQMSVDEALTYVISMGSAVPGASVTPQPLSSL